MNSAASHTLGSGWKETLEAAENPEGCQSSQIQAWDSAELSPPHRKQVTSRLGSFCPSPRGGSRGRDQLTVVCKFSVCKFAKVLAEDQVSASTCSRKPKAAVLLQLDIFSTAPLDGHLLGSVHLRVTWCPAMSLTKVIKICFGFYMFYTFAWLLVHKFDSSHIWAREPAQV